MRRRVVSNVWINTFPPTIFLIMLLPAQSDQKYQVVLGRCEHKWVENIAQIYSCQSCEKTCLLYTAGRLLIYCHYTIETVFSLIENLNCTYVI